VVCPQCGTLNENVQDKCKRCNRDLHPAAMKGKIPCFVHANREATTSCGVCGNRLCPSCAVNANGIDYCESCAPADALRTEHDEDYEQIPVVNAARATKATFVTRAMAFVVDALGILLAAGVIAIIFWLLRGGSLSFLGNFSDGSFEDPAGYYSFRIVLALAALAYIIVMTAMSGQTFGKQITGVIVLQEDGKIISLQTAILRTVSSVVSLLPFGLGYFWAIWDANHQTWHDKIAKTAVFNYEEFA